MQVRRTTRLTRTTAVLKDKENATRTTRLRAKPPSTANATENLKQAVPTKAAASTAASRAKASSIPARVDPAQGKRKREALGEVPRPPANIARPVDAGGLKGKEKEKAKGKFDGVVLKTTTTTTTTTTTIRKPLQHVGGAVRPTPTAARPTATGTATRRSTRSTAAAASVHRQQLDQVREEPEQDRLPSEGDAMAIDPPIVPVPAPKRLVAARAAAQLGHQPLAVNRANGTAHRRAAPRHVPKHDVDEAEAGRVYKKRRTSSVEPPEEDTRAEASEVERAVRLDDEANPEGDQWQDLDAEDADDPLMVSEYVVEIFEYLKKVEVRFSEFHIYLRSHIRLANDDAQSKLHGDAKRLGVEDARHPHGLAHPSPLTIPLVA